VLSAALCPDLRKASEGVKKATKEQKHLTQSRKVRKDRKEQKRLSLCVPLRTLPFGVSCWILSHFRSLSVSQAGEPRTGWSRAEPQVVANDSERNPDERDRTSPVGRRAERIAWEAPDVRFGATAQPAGRLSSPTLCGSRRPHSFFSFIAGSPHETQSPITASTQMYHGIES
jgi:hypothetical protein